MELKIGGKTINFEVLVTGKSKVLLSGDDFIIEGEPDKEQSALDYTVRAQPLRML